MVIVIVVPFPITLLVFISPLIFFHGYIGFRLRFPPEERNRDLEIATCMVNLPRTSAAVADVVSKPWFLSRPAGVAATGDRPYSCGTWGSKVMERSCSRALAVRFACW